MAIRARIAHWVVNALPPMRRLLERAGDAIREANASRRPSEAEKLWADELALQRYNLTERMNELLDLRRAEVACVNPAYFRESAAPHERVSDVATFKERLWELELALEDRGWVRETTLAMLEFSRYGVQQLIRICRIYGIKNPLIKRGAEICRLYVFGRGIEIRSDDSDADDVIQAFLEDNTHLLGHIALADHEDEIQKCGACYIALETAADGTVTGCTIDPLEIMDVVTDPDDTSAVLYFKRQWNREVLDANSGLTVPKQQICWYPSLEALRRSKPGADPLLKQIGTAPVNTEMPVYRIHGGGCPRKWRWPVPPLYASIDWARAYKDFLEDWATVQRALARFALMIQTQGGPGAIAAYQALLGTTFANSGGTQIETNPTPAVGAAHVSGPGNKIEPFKTANTQTSPEQARRMLLMTAASHGLPETFYGDASTGSLATAQSLDRPTELKFREIQQRWIEALKAIVGYVLDVSRTTPGGKLREARRANPAPQPVTVVVKFPSVLEHDIQVMIQAVAQVAAMGGRMGIPAGIVDRRTIADLMLAEIGYENRGELLEKIYGKDYDPAKDVTDQRTQVPPQSIKVATGKALSDLSIAPPLPPPTPPPGLPPASGGPPASGVPTPPPAQKGTPAAQKEALAEIIETLRGRVALIGNGH